MSKYQGDLITLVLSLFEKVGEKDCGLVAMIMWYIVIGLSRKIKGGTECSGGKS